MGNNHFTGRFIALAGVLLALIISVAACGPTEAPPLSQNPSRQTLATATPSRPAQTKSSTAPSSQAAQPAPAAQSGTTATTGSMGGMADHNAGKQNAQTAPQAAAQPAAQGGSQPTQQGQPQAQGQGGGAAPAYTANVVYTLKTGMAEGRLVFIGVGGQIEGKVNPNLNAKPGDTVQVTLINGDGVEHDIVFPELNAASQKIVARNASTAVSFKVTQEGTFTYICSIPGHRQAGMEGKLVVSASGEGQPQALGADISRAPNDLPGPLASTQGAQRHKVELETVELEGQLADGTTYTFWTFNGKVPGPFIRVKVGDTVDVTLKNRAGSKQPHSVDFHAVTGPGGGAAVTQTNPGGQMGFTFKAINPGLYVYHCATPMVAHHITNGMYGLILVEPEGGLPKVDREFYVMQGEIYTRGKLKELGHQEFDVEKLLAEQPEYVIFNGSVDALTKKYPLKANVGETVRIYFGVGGPNMTSSFHVIGEIFDRVYDEGALTTEPLKDVQTTLVPAGGSAMVEFKLDVPGRYILVDHSLSRLERGLVGFLQVEGAENAEIFMPDPNNPKTDSGGH